MAVVRMRTHISGGRGDGSEWPHTGGLLECGDGEAADLIRGGLAWPADDATPAVPAQTEPEEGDSTPEAAQAVSVAPDATGDPEDPDSPAVRAAKAEWVDHAVAKGFSRQVAEAMTKADLVAQFGN